MLKTIVTIVLIISASATHAHDFRCSTDRTIGAHVMNAPSIRFNLTVSPSENQENPGTEIFVVATLKATQVTQGSTTKEWGDLPLFNPDINAEEFAQGGTFENDNHTVDVTLKARDFKRMVEGKTFKARASFQAPFLMSTTVERNVTCRR